MIMEPYVHGAFRVMNLMWYCDYDCQFLDSKLYANVELANIFFLNYR